MKKIFLFAAAIVAALTVNAKTLDLAAVGTSISEWTPGGGATLNTSESDEAKGKYVYDIKGGDANDAIITAEPNFIFETKNTSDKKKAFVIYPGKCFEFGGKNGVLILKGVSVGAEIKLHVAAKGGTPANFADAEGKFPQGAVALSSDLVLPAKSKGAEGADDEGYIWKVLEYQAIADEVQIKEFEGGYRIVKIEVGGETPVDNVFEGAKAQKVIRNGQVLILKNGVEYNVLGTAAK